MTKEKMNQLRNNRVLIDLFRVPTSEIKQEVIYRLNTGLKSSFLEISNEDLLTYLAGMRGV